MTTRAVKLTISLPRNLISLTDEIAQERKVSRSKVISSCLQEMAEKRKLAEMEEGYKAMAKENRRLAEEALPIVLETWPSWEGKP